MTAAHPLAFPGSRTLGGWWRALAPRRPLALWVGHLLLHHVEALVRVHRPQRTDRFTLLVLQALTQAPERTVPGIDRLLHLGPRVLGRVLHGLARENLAETDAGGLWGPTPLGLRILRGEKAHGNDERRIFHFLGGNARPRFVPVRHSAEAPPVAAAEEPFDPTVLRACVSQSADWKQRHGFPLDVEDVLSLEAEVEPAPTAANHHDPAAPWQRVIVAHPERLLAVLILATDEGDRRRVEGFAVRQESWALLPEAAFTVAADWEEMLPELATEPAPEAWGPAWRSWCAQHRTSATEADGCRFELQEEKLLVQAPLALFERLRGAIGAAAEEGVWLLAGEGAIRRAARVELVNVG